MSYTKTQLVNDLALQLNVIGVGDVLATEDDALLNARVTSLVADLTARAVLYLPDIESIPDELYEGLCDVLVMRIGPSYSRPRVSQLDLEAAEDRIKSASRPTAPVRTLSTDPMLRERRSAVPTYTGWRNG